MLQNAAAYWIDVPLIHRLARRELKGTCTGRDREMQKKMMWAGWTNQAAKRGRPNATLVVAAVLALSSALSGCSSLYSEGAVAGAGVAGAAVAGKVTSNAAVATGIGLGAVAAARAGVQYSERVVHRNTQDGIAKIAGPLAVGAVAPWSVTHSFPIEDDEHGRVTVSRAISTGALDCKEIVFSVDTTATKNVPASSAFYVASICRDGDNWKWASAEPATERWGALQ
ncbi:hypothetical protein ABH945_002993 [Paraburkholderia sp. GAS333]